jgi:hypothetical protein
MPLSAKLVFFWRYLAPFLPMNPMVNDHWRCNMTEINPLAGVILGSIQQQRVLGIEKTRQLHRSKMLEKNVAAEDEQMESEVENTEEIKPIGDEDGQKRETPQRHHSKEPKEEKPHIDIRG